MIKSINERYVQPGNQRNDIFRKFEKQYKYCFLNPISIPDELYIEHRNNTYKEAFDVFFNSGESDIKFFIGYTGVGKTTFIKHYFGYSTLGVSLRGDSAIIPTSWDGRKIPEDYTHFIDTQISNVIDNLIKQLYKSYEDIILCESDEVLDFIEGSRPDILSSLTIEEIIRSKANGCTLNQFKLQKCKNNTPVEFSCSLLKYVITKQKLKQPINRLIFIIDDLETLSQSKLCYILDSYIKIYACMHNISPRPIVNLLVSLRPHSFRYLRNDITHQYISSYGNYLQLEIYRLIKNEIPDIKKIFITRFENAIKNTPKPGNPSTWDAAKKVFYEIINDFDDNLVSMISDLCHMNIRAITDCFQMILSNRVWCQEFDEDTGHPTVRQSDYRFDVVNVIRTLACGENPIYTGNNDIQFNSNNAAGIQARPSFDDSKVFIPNLFINLVTRECDVLPAVIVQYLDGYFSSMSGTPPHTEFITKDVLCDNLYIAFCRNVSKEQIIKVVDYLFENRIVRKSIISKDSDESINLLRGDDYIYLTLKGSRLLQMLESDSVLLEVYREDIRRYYSDDTYYKSSFEMISSNNRFLLFEDLIKLADEIYHNEDMYQGYIVRNASSTSFYTATFPITTRILNGIEKSLTRSQNLDMDKKSNLQNSIIQLRRRINERISENSRLQPV